MNDIARAYNELKRKTTAYTKLWRYYEGDHPLVYSAQRLKAVFHNLDARFIENWCAVVVDAVADRINLTGFAVADNEKATGQLNHAFARTELGLDSDDAHLAAFVCGEGYIIVWPNDKGEPDAYYNDPRQCMIHYDSDNPRVPLYAAKWWLTDDDRYRMTLYYPERLEYYETAAKAIDVYEYTAFKPMETPAAANPFGVVPVFHLRRSGRAIQSELANAIPLQNAVNKLLSDMMVAAEFGAFRQRYVISNMDLGALKNAPNEIWTIPANDGQGEGTQVGEFGQADLGMYLSAIDKLASAIAIITRTPKHYLFQQGGDPSGEALIAMEAPLVRKAGRYLERFTATWRRIGAFLLQLQGVTVAPESITPLFDVVETVNPRMAAEVGLLKNQAGVSKQQIQRELGYSDEQIAAMQVETDASSAMMGEQLLTAFDRGV